MSAIELLGEVAIARRELQTIALQAGRYEAYAVSREASLAFNLVRALAQNVESVLEHIDTALREKDAA